MNSETLVDYHGHNTNDDGVNVNYVSANANVNHVSANASVAGSNANGTVNANVYCHNVSTNGMVLIVICCRR